MMFPTDDCLLYRFKKSKDDQRETTGGPKELERWADIYGDEIQPVQMFCPLSDWDTPGYRVSFRLKRGNTRKSIKFTLFVSQHQ